MSSTVLIIIIAIAAVAFFVVGLSLTLIIKGRHMQSEVGENDHMKMRGLKCATQQIREDEAALRGVPLSEIEGGCIDGTCGSCTTVCDPAEKEKQNRDHK